MRLMVADAPLREILEGILLAFEALSPGALCSVLLLDPATRRLGLGAAPSLPSEYNRAIEGMEIGPAAGSCGTAAWTGKAVIVEDLETDPLWVPFRALAARHGLRACWSTPVLGGRGEVLATFAVYYREPRRPAQHELDLLSDWTHLVGLAVIRDRRDAELCTLGQRLLDALENIDSAFFTVDRDWRLTYVNAEAERQVRRSRHEIMGRRLWEEFPESVGTRLHQGTLRAMEERVTVLVEEFSPSTGTWVEARIHPSPEGLAVYYRDITARREAEERLRQQAALLDAARDAISLRDLDHRLLYWNRSAQRVYGWTPEEALGRSMETLLERASGEFRQAARATLEQGAWMGEFELELPGGELRIVESRWTLVRDPEGRPVSILAIDTDITERRRLEQQFLRTQRLESLGTLASGIAHDLNNLLAPILNSMELLREGEADPDRARLLDTLQLGAERGRELVAQVLTFARGAGGRRVEVRLPEVVRDLVKLLGDSFPKNVQIRVDLAGDLWSVRADPTQLHQVLLNLCVNARDAMPQGGTLSIRARNARPEGSCEARTLEALEGPCVCLEVEDTGAGIPRELLGRIFDPFFTTKPEGQGSGLGLSTTLGIIRSHGGFLHVDSEPGKGSRFRFHLPAVPFGAGPDGGRGPHARPRGNGETVLVVDDEAELRQMTCRVLELHGYRTLQAADGAQALTPFARHRAEVGVLLLDMGLPGRDGPAILRELLELDPAVRVVGTSGWEPEHPCEGLRGFLPKPFEMETLLQAVRQALQADPGGPSAGSQGMV